MKLNFDPNEEFIFNRTLKHLKCTVWTRLTENQKQRFLKKELWPEMDKIAKDLSIEFDILDKDGVFYLLVSREDLLVGAYNTVKQLKDCMRVFLNNVEKLKPSVLSIETCERLLKQVETIDNKQPGRDVAIILNSELSIVYIELLKYYISHEQQTKGEPKTL